MEEVNTVIAPIVGMTSLLTDAISKKYELINDMNSIKINAEDEEYEDLNPVIDSIIEDENNHIGKLQQLLDLMNGSEEAIEEGKAETIEIIDNPEIMESMTTMSKKLRLDENFDNVIDDVQAVEDSVFVGANKEHDENKKRYEDAIEENKEAAEETIPKEEETGKKVTSKALKAMHLSEALFEGLNPDFAQSCADDISEYIMTEFVDLNNSEIREVLKYVIKHFSSPDLEESLDFDTYSDFNREIYNALADVIYDYQDKNITSDDINKAIDWFQTHFFDDVDIEDAPKINHMTGVKESYEVKTVKEYEDGSMDRDLLKDGKKIGEIWDDGTVKLIDSDKFSDEEKKAIEEFADGKILNESVQVGSKVMVPYHDGQVGRVIKVKGNQVYIEWDDGKNSVHSDSFYKNEVKPYFGESIQMSIAKEQLKRISEGKMPKNLTADKLIESLVDKKHISKSEAKSLKEWYKGVI